MLPLLPVYFSILGLRAGNQTGQRRGWLFYNGLSFCLGLSVIFIALGAVATSLGRFLSDHLELICRIAGGLAVLMGVLTLFSGKIPFFNREKRMEVNRAPGLLTSFLMGMAFAFGWVPCVSAPLASILLLASVSATMWRRDLALGMLFPGLYRTLSAVCSLCRSPAPEVSGHTEIRRRHPGGIRPADDYDGHPVVQQCLEHLPAIGEFP